MSADLIEALRAGDAAIVATDTVYGLVALPSTRGLERIFELKGRPSSQALPWLVGSAEEFDRFGADVPTYARRLADMFWPGALTLVVKASESALSLGDVAGDLTIALRCPDDEQLLTLLEELDGPLACTSANEHGQLPATRRDQVPESMRELAGFEELEDCEGDLAASTIVDCTGPFPQILREGPIPEQVVLDVAVFGATLTD